MTGTAPRDLLYRRIVATLAEIDTHRDEIGRELPPSIVGPSGLDDPRDAAIAGSRHQHIAEAALTLLVIHRFVPRDRVLRGRMRGVGDFLAELVHSERSVSLLRRYPHLALSSLGTSAIILEQLGYVDPHVHALLARSIADGGTEVERLPYQLVQRRWARGLFESRDLPMSDVLGHTTLHVMQHPLHLSRGEMYSITHTIWFATDLGRRPLPLWLERPRIVAILTALLSNRLLAGDVDLVVELLLCRLYLGGPWEAADEVAWRMLDILLREHHALPRLGEDGFAVPDAFSARYHTTYMGAQLWAVARVSNRELGQAEQSSSALDGEAMLEALTLAGIDHRAEASTGAPAALLLAASCNADWITPIVVDGAVGRAVRTNDLSRLQRLLAFAQRHDISTMSTQAAATYFWHRSSDFAVGATA